MALVQLGFDRLLYMQTGLCFSFVCFISTGLVDLKYGILFFCFDYCLAQLQILALIIISEMGKRPLPM